MASFNIHLNIHHFWWWMGFHWILERGQFSLSGKNELAFGLVIIVTEPDLLEALFWLIHTLFLFSVAKYHDWFMDTRKTGRRLIKYQSSHLEDLTYILLFSNKLSKAIFNLE